MARVTWMGAAGLLAVAVVLVSGLPGRAAPVVEPAPKGETPVEKLRKELDKPITLDPAGQGLSQTIDQLRDTCKINISLDVFTLNQMGFSPDQMPVTGSYKDAKLRTVLRGILAQHNLSYALIGDTIVVSTDAACIHRQMTQRVVVDVEKADLAAAVKKLARETGTNIVVDSKVAKEAATPVTMQLDDVPLDTAVRLMAEMAGLKVVRIANVLYVCSKTQANEMRQDPDLNPGGVPGTTVPVDQLMRPGFLLPPGIGPGFPGAVPGVPGVPGGIGGIGGMGGIGGAVQPDGQVVPNAVPNVPMPQPQPGGPDAPPPVPPGTDPDTPVRDRRN